MSSQSWRIVITIALIILAIIGSWSTIRLWAMSAEEKERMEQRNPGSVGELEAQAMRLGLDLQGGIHMVLRVRLDQIEPSARDGAVERAIQVIRNRVDYSGVVEPVIQKQGEDRIIVDLPGYTDAEQAERLIGEKAQLLFKLPETFENAQMLINQIDSVVAEVKEEEGLEFEMVEPEPGMDPLEIAEPETGEADPLDFMDTDTTGETDTLEEDLYADPVMDEDLYYDEGRPFSQYLEHFLFSDYNNMRTPWPGYIVARRDRAVVEKMLEMPQVQRLIPEEIQFSWSTREETVEQRPVYRLYVLKTKVQFYGRHLERISTGQGQFGEQTVDFRLSGRAAAAFARLTSANLGKPLAIVIDDRVESAPIIQSKISTQGQITMGGGATYRDAVTLANMLRAGALPAPVEIIEKNVVGPTLGSDSIRKGLVSSAVGLLFVLFLIGIYYRVSGVIADVALVFNIFFLLAIMAGYGATLTMPGIAGIILTIGISVDANILIFERIREELRTGKTVRASIDAGYNRAMWTIVDSHVTTLITALALFLFGSGPIKGFAVTLFWGVLISLYTAVVITKTIFDFRKQYKTLSI